MMLAWGGLGKLSHFCYTDREFYQSFLWRFILFPFTKLPILPILQQVRNCPYKTQTATTGRQPVQVLRKFVVFR